jgi:hypothetical protein
MRDERVEGREEDLREAEKQISQRQTPKPPKESPCGVVVKQTGREAENPHRYPIPQIRGRTKGLQVGRNFHHTAMPNYVAVASVNFKQSVEKVADVDARARWLSECFQWRIEQNCHRLKPSQLGQRKGCCTDKGERIWHASL